MKTSIAAIVISLLSMSMSAEVYVREAEMHGYRAGIAYNAAIVIGWPVRHIFP